MFKLDHLHAVDYSHLNGGNRVGFFDPKQPNLWKVNPRNALGLFGVCYHGYLASFFHRTVNVWVVEAYTWKERHFYLDKQDLVADINARTSISYCNPNETDQEIINKIRGLNCLFELKKGQKADFKPSFPPKLNQRSLSSLLDRIKAVLWHCFYRLIITSWTFFRLRFALSLAEKTLRAASEILSVAAYRQALAVPAYRQLIQSQKQKPLTFDELPITSKATYIQPALNAKEEQSLYLGGKIPIKFKRDTSTGTSGKPTPWYRGEKEQYIVERLSSYTAKALLGNCPYSLINGFVCGPWATGITVTLAANRDSQAGISVIGSNIKEIFECIKEQVRLHPKGYPIIVGCYPLHLRAVIDLAVAEDFPLHTHHVIGVVGGEAMSEDLRDLLVAQIRADGTVLRTGLQQCYSFYGASDLDIRLGHESNFEIELRKICHEPRYKALAEELFGENKFIPMIFQYDPLNYAIEVDEEQNLLFTCLRQDRISPRVRYNLGDKGKVMAASDVLAVLHKYGVTLKNPSKTGLPLLFVWGRGDSMINFRGAKVAPENLRDAISKLDETSLPGLKAKINHYAFYQREVKGYIEIEIWLEFDESEYSNATKEFFNHILRALSEVNSDFQALLQSCPKNEYPCVRVFKKGESPMHVQQTLSMHKKQYVFREGDEYITNYQVGRLISYML